MKKATKKVAKKEVRIPTYKGSDGEYLKILIEGYEYKIGWYFPDEGEFGLMLSNDSIGGQINNTAIETLKSFFKDNNLELPLPHKEFTLDSQRQAVRALRTINAAIHYHLKNRPAPDWVKKAIQAGWTPPKGKKASG